MTLSQRITVWRLGEYENVNGSNFVIVDEELNSIAWASVFENEYSPISTIELEKVILRMPVL